MDYKKKYVRACLVLAFKEILATSATEGGRYERNEL